MPRRIEIELTSHTADGSWTWRAAGARQPRGTLGGDVVPTGASVGDVLRAEVETGIDGIDVVAVHPARPARSDEERPGRIEVIGSPRRAPDVSVILAPGTRRRRDDDRRAPGARGPQGGPRGEAPAPGRRGGERGERGEGARVPSRPGRAPSGDGGATGRRGAPRRGPAGPVREREHRPALSTAHRNAMMAALRPEQLPVAEQLLRGGMPAVRRAIDEQNAAARASGAPPASVDALVAMAEVLLPTVRLAEWKDRATSAQAAGRDFRLRELRAVVVASRTVTLDDEGRALAKALQEALEHRVGALRDEWLSRITTALDEGRVLDALRTTARAPEPGTRCPADLAVRLAAMAGAAMTAGEASDRWLALLDAVIDSPVRRTVKPEGIPAEAETQAAARNAAGLVPELAKLLGIRVPPPPPQLRRTVVRPTASPAPRERPPRPAVSPVDGGGSASGS